VGLILFQAIALSCAWVPAPSLVESRPRPCDDTSRAETLVIARNMRGQRTISLQPEERGISVRWAKVKGKLRVIRRRSKSFFRDWVRFSAPGLRGWIDVRRRLTHTGGPV